MEYSTRSITHLNKPAKILMQAGDGPCSLLALSNCLSLMGELDFTTLDNVPNHELRIQLISILPSVDQDKAGRTLETFEEGAYITPK
jgi:hypothetical protein